MSNNLNILKSAGIYGPNNSGKTCLIKCIKAIRNILLHETFSLSANMFSNSSISHLGVTFLEEGRQFLYDIKYDNSLKEYVYERFAECIKDEYGNEREEVWMLKDYLKNEYVFNNNDLKSMAEMISRNNLLIYQLDVKKFEKLDRIKSLITTFASKNYFRDVKAMNITFLIGNGFDLNLGLHTRYTDFLKEYREKNTPEETVISYFKNSILKDEFLWSSAEEAFGIATKQFKTDGYNAEDYCNCHEDFCNSLAEYLSRQEQRLNYTSLNNIISTTFAKSILNYKNGFRTEEKNILIQNEKHYGDGFKFNFINFNYTNTLDSCASASNDNPHLLGRRNLNGALYQNSIGEILHVHGTIHKDMVLGVNDISQISDVTLFNGYDAEFINEIIKQRTNELNEENTDNRVYELLQSSDVIYIYGMSTGITDKLWWERICDIMTKKKSVHLIIHKFDAPEDKLIRRTFRLYVKEKRQEFVSYCNLDEAVKTELQERIHIDRTNIFESLSDLVNNEANHIEEGKQLQLV